MSYTINNVGTIGSINGDWQPMPDGSIAQGNMRIKNIGGKPAAEVLAQHNKPELTVDFGKQNLRHLGLSARGGGFTIGKTVGVEDPWIKINNNQYIASNEIEWRNGKDLYLDGKLTSWC